MEQLQKMFSFQPSLISDHSNSQERSTVLGWNTCYVVCGLVVKDDKILMVQEAKRSCRGLWYMPAGRVERNESLEDAVRREVKEESGMEFNPKALIAVEFQTFSWIRFTFVGDITGGKLKTPDEEDKESIQAQWLPVDIKELRKNPTRASDCFPLIELAQKWFKEDPSNRCDQVTQHVPHKSSSMSVVLIKHDGDQINVLLKDDPQPNATAIPWLVVTENSTPFNQLEKTLKSAGYHDDYITHGVLNLEHQVQGGDGIHLSLLISARTSELKQGCGFSWSPIVDPVLVEKIKKCVQHDFALGHLIDLWR